MGAKFSQFRNLNYYKCGNQHVIPAKTILYEKHPFVSLYWCFLQIMNGLTPRGAGIYEIWNP